MRENNKRKREDEPYYLQNVSQTHSYQGIASPATQNVAAPTTEQNQPFNQSQSLVLNQPILQNQQLLYQLQRSTDTQQNLVYLIVPSNDNILVQGDQQEIANQQYIINAQANSINREGSEVNLHDGAKEVVVAEKTEYYTDNLVDKHTKNVQYSYTVPKQHDIKTEINSSYANVNTYVGQVKTTGTVLKDHANTSKPHLYRCDYKDCSECFYSLYEKKLHLDTHIFPENNEFKCSICNMVFEKAVDRNKHVESHSIAPTYKCRQCLKDFAYYTVLVKHLEEKKCSVKNPVTCFICKTKFTDSFDLIKHHVSTIKQCVCGTKMCAVQAFEVHLSGCGVVKSNDKVQGPNDRKRVKSRKS